MTEKKKTLKGETGKTNISFPCGNFEKMLKKIRNSKGSWEQIDAYIESRSDTSFTHSMCPDCLKSLYGNEDWYIKMVEDNNGEE